MPDLWSIVLAAGRGTRLAGVTGGLPKQFWSPSGDRSLLEETAARLEPLTDRRHRLTVVDDTHRDYVAALKNQESLGEVIYQPADRGTAAGLLLAAVAVSISDPSAVVVVTPSDHGIADDGEFRHGVATGAGYAQSHPEEVVLFGAEPVSPTGDYGWITISRPAGGPAEVAPVVASFVEKPAASTAERLLTSGAVWNTMVLVARVEAVLSLFRRYVPDLASAFEGMRFLDRAHREQHVRRMYDHLPVVDFSHDILMRASGLHCLTWRASMGWTDLGTPDRLAAWLTDGRNAPGRQSAVVH